MLLRFPIVFRIIANPINMALRPGELNKPYVPKVNSSLRGRGGERTSGPEAENKGRTPGRAGRAQKASTLGR